MATYMIFLREGAIVDHEAMAEYQAGNRDAPPSPGLEPLAVYGEMETLEGDAADGMVILKFPDRDAAAAWYHGEDYQSRIPARQKAAHYRAFMVEGL